MEKYSDFENIFTNILEKHAPLKTKFLRANNKPHVTKELRKAIMKRTHLKSLANKSNKPEDWAHYRTQRNLVLKLNKQAKKAFFNSTTRKSKHFWDAIKPQFSDKNLASGERIQLLENNILYSNDENVAKIFNSYFNRITDHLEIPSWESQNLPLNPDDTLKSRFENHPSINVIKAHQVSGAKFDFLHVEEKEVLQEILDLNSSKCVSGNIPTKVLKLAAYISAPFLTSCFNDCIDTLYNLSR